MKALRIKAFQETTCYTRPFANKVTETYPLPPYSTVKGMIHAVLKAEEYIPFSLSIQGDYDSIITDYRKTYFIKKSTVNMPIVFDGLSIEATPTFPDMSSMPLYTHMLYRVNLVLHLHAEEEILQDIYVAFQNLDHFLSLGRQEDLLRIDAVDMVDLEELDLFIGEKLRYNMYIPIKKIYEDEVNTGISYQLNWVYRIKKGIREWERIPSLYVEKGKIINADFLKDTAYIDEEGHIVIWNQ